MRALKRTLTTPAALALILLAIAGCRRPKDGDSFYGNSNSAPPIVEPSDTELTDAEELPGLNITVLEVGGAGGDSFESGDNVSVTFTVTRDDGSSLAISELDRLEANISGPTFNYQRVIGRIKVIPSIGEVSEDVSYNDDGSYTYTFPSLPDNYIAPNNDTTDLTDGELTDTPLLAGTYTFVLVAYKNYTVGTRVVKDVANVAQDFLFGTDILEPREVVTTANCNQCHDTVQYHDGGLPGGGRRRDVRTCVTCHVAGAEDINDPAVAGGTPGETVEFKVMIHKIHNGGHLPSVFGIGTNADGSRNMMVPPKPYELVNDELVIEDFSGILFPVWPNFNVQMPKDYGYTLSSDPATTPLAFYVPPIDGGAVGGNFGAGDTAAKYTSPTALNGRTWQQNDSSTRTGVTACAKCHGDPDDAGPLAAPAQGALAYTQPSRRACGSCHDDIDWTLPYRSNLKTMPPQADDSLCITCHVEGGGGSDTTLFVENAHKHPLTDPDSWPAPYNDLALDILSLTPSSGTTLDPGETLAVRFTIKNGAGENVPIPLPGTPKVGAGIAWGGLSFGTGSGYPWPESAAAWWSGISMAIAGPTTNYNILLAVDFPTDNPGLNYGVVPNIGLPNEGEYTMNVPQYLPMDDFGNATGVAGTTHGHPYGAGFLPIYNSPWSVTDIQEATVDNAAGPATVSVAAAPAGQNYIDVSPTVPAFVRGNYIRIDCGPLPAAVGANREFLRVGDVEVVSPTVTRIWFQSSYEIRGLMANSTGFGSLYGPWLRKSHAVGVPVVRIDLAPRALTANYTIDPSATLYKGTGLITEVAGFGTGVILASFSTDWVMPSYYPPAFRGGTDLDETWGTWASKPTTPGTYSVAMWTYYTWAHKADTTWPDWVPTIIRPWTGNIDYGYAYEVNSYRLTTNPSTTDMLVRNLAVLGVPTPTEFEPYDIISTSENCLKCHNEIRFHGASRRNFETCIVCHGTAGLGIRQNYVAYPAAGQPPWPRGLKNTANFRTFLHQAHRDYLPTMPDGSRHCAKCHGEPELESEPGTWEYPGDRDHPTAQVLPVKEWRGSCGGCHDTDEALAHFDLMTAPSGYESCGTCHNVGATYGVGIMHKPK